MQRHPQHHCPQEGPEIPRVSQQCCEPRPTRLSHSTRAQSDTLSPLSHPGAPQPPALSLPRGLLSAQAGCGAKPETAGPGVRGADRPGRHPQPQQTPSRYGDTTEGPEGRRARQSGSPHALASPGSRLSLGWETSFPQFPALTLTVRRTQPPPPHPPPLTAAARHDPSAKPPRLPVSLRRPPAPSSAPRFDPRGPP